MQLKNWTNCAIFKLRLGNVKQKWREVHDDVYPLSSLLRKYYFIETLSLPHTKKSTWYFLSFLTRNTSSIVLSSSLQQLISCYFFCRFKNSSILPLRTKSCQESFFPRLMMTFSSPLKSIVLNCMKSFKKTRHVNPCLFWVEIYTRFWQWKIRSKVHIFPFTKSH